MQSDVQQDFYVSLGIKVGFCDPACGPAMPFVIRVDRGQSLGRFLRSREAKHSFAVGQERAYPGVLHDYGFAAGQIADGSVADPGVLESHIRPLSATELTA